MTARNDHFWCDLQFKVGMSPIDEASKADLSQSMNLAFTEHGHAPRIKNILKMANEAMK